MPENASAVAAPVSTGNSGGSPATGGSGGGEDVKITYGSPEGDSNVGEVEEKIGGDTEIDGAEGEGSGDVDEFGELDADFDEGEGAAPEKFTSEQYKALKQALAANPELFKAVKRQLSENTRYSELFESPEAARAQSERIEALGGIDGIESESQEWNKVFEMFSNGDPGVIDYWAKDNPQALAKLFPHVYDKIADLDPGVWAHKAAGTFIATAQQTGMMTALGVLSKLEAVRKSPEATEQVNAIIESLNKLNEIAQKPPTADLSPQAKELSEREKNLKAQENQLYQKSVSQQVTPIVNKQALNALTAVLKGRKITPEARKNLLRDMNLEYAALAKKDEQFQKNAKALLASNETEKFIKLVTANLTRTMPLAAKRVWRKYTGISGIGDKEAAQRRAEGQARREAGGGGAAINVVQGGAPKSNEIDWPRMRSEFGKDVEDVFMFGKKGYYGGKRVYFKKGEKTAYTY